jgi:hypothetical protein
MPVLSVPLDEILVFRRKPYETFTLSLSNNVNPDTPAGELFFEPIQVGILNLTSKRVKLCVHAHEAIEISLDGFIDDALIEHFKNEHV